jgi:hypothetical protein
VSRILRKCCSENSHLATHIWFFLNQLEHFRVKPLSHIATPISPFYGGIFLTLATLWFPICYDAAFSRRFEVIYGTLLAIPTLEREEKERLKTK